MRRVLTMISAPLLAALLAVTACAVPAAAATGVLVSVSPPSTDPVAPGTVTSTVVSATNTAATDSAAATVAISRSKTIPASLTYGPGVTCTAVGASRYSSTYRMNCAVPPIAAGQTVTVVTITWTAPTPSAYSRIGYGVTATGPDNVASAAYSVHLTGPADLVPSVYVSPSTVLAQRAARVTASVFDAGYSDAAGFAATLTLPSGVTNVVVTSGYPWAACTQNGSQIDCLASVLSWGTSASLTVDFVAPANAGSPAIAFTVDTSGVVSETNESNNSASVTLTVLSAAANLAVAVANPASVPLGSLVTRTVTVTNIGNAVADNVSVTDSFTSPTLVSVTSSTGSACSTYYTYGRFSRRYFHGARCLNAGSLAPGASLTMTVVVGLAATAGVTTYTDAATATTTSFSDPFANPRATSSFTAFVPAEPVGPVSTAVPSISAPNTVVATTVAMTSSGTWWGYPAPVLGERWQICDAGGAACSDIPGATGTTYQFVPADVGHTIRLVVTATNAGGAVSTASAAVGPVVAPVAPSNVGLPTISGLDNKVGYAYTTNPGTWSGTPVITFTYQWQRCDETSTVCADIAGATAQSYVLQWADVNNTVRVVVTASNTGGSAVAVSANSGMIDPPDNGG